MDAGKLFVLLLTIFAVGVLVYLEVRSRRSRRGSTESATSPAGQDNNMHQHQ